MITKKHESLKRYLEIQNVIHNIYKQRIKLAEFGTSFQKSSRGEKSLDIENIVLFMFVKGILEPFSVVEMNALNAHPAFIKKTAELL